MFGFIKRLLFGDKKTKLSNTASPTQNIISPRCYMYKGHSYAINDPSLKWLDIIRKIDDGTWIEDENFWIIM